MHRRVVDYARKPALARTSGREALYRYRRLFYRFECRLRLTKFSQTGRTSSLSNGKGRSHGKVGKALQYVGRSRTDGVSTDGPASLGHQRRVGKKVSSYGYQDLSNPNAGKQVHWGGEGLTGLLPRMRCQRR